MAKCSKCGLVNLPWIDKCINCGNNFNKNNKKARTTSNNVKVTNNQFDIYKSDQIEKIFKAYSNGNKEIKALALERLLDYKDYIKSNDFLSFCDYAKINIEHLPKILQLIKISNDKQFKDQLFNKLLQMIKKNKNVIYNFGIQYCTVDLNKLFDPISTSLINIDRRRSNVYSGPNLPPIPVKPATCSG